MVPVKSLYFVDIQFTPETTADLIKNKNLSRSNTALGNWLSGKPVHIQNFALFPIICKFLK